MKKSSQDYQDIANQIDLEYYQKCQALANQIQQEVVKPFCKLFNLHFISGMGTCAVFLTGKTPKLSHDRFRNKTYFDLAELLRDAWMMKNLTDYLDVTASYLNSNLSALMPEFVPSKETR